MTTFVHYQTHQGYQLGLSFQPGKATLDQLVELLSAGRHNNATRPQNTLNGRREAVLADLREIGPIVVKAYARGGLIYHINKERYLRRGKPRCQLAFEFMREAAAVGVNVPEPIAFATLGKRIYRAWLITRVVANHRTFAAICQTDADRAKMLMPAISDNINKLIGAKIHHVDLHPGNILIDDRDTPYIIDFDRARIFFSSKTRLWKKYQRRWDRAIDKHGLPPFAKAVLTKKQTGQ
jgi:tRNA A-37 threonylcarbamoyl transferase component Bud32